MAIDHLAALRWIGRLCLPPLFLLAANTDPQTNRRCALGLSNIFALFSVIRPRWSTQKLAAAALLLAYAIEFSQIYHRPWIDHIRSYTLGKLILGTTFFWWDQFAYTLGVAAIMPVDVLLVQAAEKKTIKNLPGINPS